VNVRITKVLFIADFFALEVCYLFGGIDYPISGCKNMFTAACNAN